MGSVTIDQALLARRSCRSFDGRAIPRELLRRLLWSAQGITDDTGKRTAPSAHALHPLRLRVVTGNVEGLPAGLYSFDPVAAELFRLADGEFRNALEDVALDEQPWVGRASAIIAVCADFESPMEAFADQPPVGERGSRYVYIEAGAAAQNVQLQAAAEGLGCVLVAGFDDAATSAVLKLDPPLVPVLYLCIGWPHHD